jgi:uncharacterized membrane protein YqjE
VPFASITLLQLLLLFGWIVAQAPAPWRPVAVLVILAAIVAAAILWRRSQARRRQALYDQQPLPGGDPRISKRRR